MAKFMPHYSTDEFQVSDFSLICAGQTLSATTPDLDVRYWIFHRCLK
jgi:hypothetical protein